MKLQEGFRDLVAVVNERCAARFGLRLRAAYLGGSVPVGEAWPGASDLDWFVFLQASPHGQMGHGNPAREGNLRPVFRSRRKSISTSTRWTDSCARNPGGSSCATMRFESEARISLPSWRVAESEHLVRAADWPGPGCRGCANAWPKQWRADARPHWPSCLPTPPLATRKLARNFVIVEGAHVLMARGAFKSFTQDAVLQGLRDASRRWRPLLRMTEDVFEDPYRAEVSPNDFMKEVCPFMNWAIALIENA